MDLVVQTGFRKPLIHLTIKDRHDLISSLLDYHLMAKVKTEMDQFKEGLQTFSFLDIVRENPDLWKKYFLKTDETLTPGKKVSICFLIQFII